MTEALEVIGHLLVHLHRHTPPSSAPLRTLADVGATHLAHARWVTVPDGELAAAIDGCAGALADVLPEPGDRLLHWDLHFTNVLAPLPGAPAAERGDWLAIDPKPLIGDPGYELLPSIHNRWDEALATGDPAREALRRFDLLTEVVGVERDRATAWTLARCLANLLWLLEGHAAWFREPDLVVARALLGRRR